MPMKRKEYPANWEWLSRQVRQRNGCKCELCDAKNGDPHWKTESKVVLTVHHIDGDKKNNVEQNLISLCQRCHLRLDLHKHMKNRRASKNNIAQYNHALHTEKPWPMPVNTNSAKY